jgi:energy-coupling factor transporter ATP-binding protein EcfA2
MPLIETLTVNVAASLAKAAAKVWLKDPGSVGAAEGIIETLKRRGDDFLTARRTGDLFQHLETDVAQRMERLIAAEFPGLEEGDQNAGSLAVGAALSSLDLSESLMRSDLDATRLELAILNTKPDAFLGLGEPAAELARRLLKECCNYIVRIAGTLPDFHAESTAELLKRDRGISDDLRRVLDELDRIRSDRREDAAHRTAAFEDQYRITVLQHLDRNRLFGLRLVGAGARAEQLSSTYVPQALVPLNSAQSEPLETAIGQSQLLLIRGEAGFGKTTLMQWLAVLGAKRGLAGPLARWNQAPPFYLRLRDWRDAHQPFPKPEEFLSGPLLNLAGVMPQGWVYEMLGQGGVVLLDGVDEIPATRRPQLFEWLEGLVATFRNASFVVSSRPAALDAEKPLSLGHELTQLGFRSLTLEPMTLFDSLALVSRWHAAVARDLVDPEGLAQLARNEHALCQAIRDRTAIRNLAANPLLCAMMCALNWERRQHLPDDRMELYRLALELLLERREEARQIGVIHARLLDRASKEKLLDGLAYWMLRNGYSEAVRADVEETIAQALPRLAHLQDTPATLLQELLERSGVLREPQHGFVDFVHRTFMEYMGARAAVATRDFGALVDKAREESWREVVVFAAGHATERDRDDLIRRLLKPRLLRRWPVDAQVTAVCCLETAGRNLNPELLQQLQELARTLFPPGDFARAQLLAPAAAANPELLEGHQARTAAEIAACIRTAAIVGGERMLRVIESYAKQEGEAIDQEIARAWLAFEEASYEKRVVALRDHFFGARLSELTPEEAECLKVLLLLKRPRDPAENLTNGLQEFIANRSLNVFRLWGYRTEPGDEEDDLPPAIAATQKVLRVQSTSLGIGPAVTKRIARLRSLHLLSLSTVEPSVVPTLQELTELESLSMDLKEPADLDLVARLPKITQLRLSGAGIVRLTAFRAAPSLIAISVEKAPNYKAIDFIGADSPIRKISIKHTEVTDLWPLLDARGLDFLQVAGLDIADFGPLTRLAELSELGILYPKRDAKIPYAQLSRLHRLTLQGTTPSFFEGLADLSELKELQINFIPDFNFACLGVMPELSDLSLFHVKVCNSAALVQLPMLRRVRFSDCKGDFLVTVATLLKRGVLATIA